jgi:hypothetical protein
VLLEQLGLVGSNVLRTQAIRRTVEVSREILDGAKVTACGSLRVMTTLGFLQHPFS